MSPRKFSSTVVANLRRVWRDRFVREVFCWCLPALLAGLALRGTLLARMPAAFYHPDSYTVFETGRALVGQGVFHIYPKKTFLAPVLYALPVLLRLPVLPSIAIAQHGLGLVLVFVVGLLVALSFQRWRLFIVPVTMLVALDPALLWYEHTCLPESLYVLGVAGTALTGLLLYRWPRKATLFTFSGCLFLVAASRPEGKLWCLFGVALVVRIFWADRRHRVWAGGGMVLLTLLCLVVDRTSQSGSLLYSNIAHLTPDRFVVAPGFVEANEEYFHGLRERWQIVPTKIPHERHQLLHRARLYLASTLHHEPTSIQAEKLCGRVASEIAVRSVFRLPGLALMKFRYGLNEAVAPDFGADWTWRKQAGAFLGNAKGTDEPPHNSSTTACSSLVLGRTFQSSAELTADLHQTWHPFAPDWLSEYNQTFQRLMLTWRLPDQHVGKHKFIRGFPILFLLAGLGLLAQAIRERHGLNYYHLWLLALVGMLFILALTGSNKGRFRIIFEPFWMLYALALVDALVDAVLGLISPKTVGSSASIQTIAAERIDQETHSGKSTWQTGSREKSIVFPQHENPELSPPRPPGPGDARLPRAG